MSSYNPSVQHVVTAVIVAHDGAAWIPHVTRALREQSRPVDRVVAVDTGSRDRSGAMLAEVLGRGAVFGMDRSTGYAVAVHQALRHRAANSHLPPLAGGAERVEWIWLLHDDCEPDPDALERLLRGAAATPGVAVLGPKVKDWSDRGVLLEAGFTIDRVGRRITGIEPREMDQGQHDGDRDVLAVGSAGMLVRRDVWERVGGFDPSMRLYRDDIDFCWRVLAAGHRVRLVTDAVVYHVEASARNRRQASAAPRGARQDRRNALLVLAGNLPLGPMAAALAGAAVLSLLRTLFFLLAKRPKAAMDESGALASVLLHPLRLAAARRRRARGRRAAYSRVRADLPKGQSLRKLMEYASLAFSKSHQTEMVGSHHATDDPDGDDSLLVDTGLVQRLLTSPGVLLFLGLAAVAAVSARSLLFAPPLSGGALVPAWGGASGLWQEYLQAFHPAGLGTAADAPPYVAVIALLATVLGGKPWLAVNVILIGCVPFAGATAFVATRRITGFVPARVWAALAYALLPVCLGTVAAGRLGMAVVLVLLPLAGVAGARIFTEGRRRARRAAWAAALTVAVATAFVPLTWVIAVVVLVVAAVAYSRDRAQAAVNAGIVALVPPVLLLPWSIGLFAHPAELLLEAGLQPPGLASAALPARSLLMLSPGGPGLPPFWVTAGLAVAAVAALAAGARRALVLAGWGVALIGLIAAAAVSRIVIAPEGSGPPVPAWPGVALAVAGAGLAMAAAASGDRMAGLTARGRWRGPRGLAVLALAAIAASTPALAAAFWVAGGVRGPVTPSAGPLLPEFVSVSSATGLRLRTLVLRGDGRGGVSYSVLRATEPPIGAEDLATPPAARQALNRAVGELTAPAGSGAVDQGRTLAGFDIGYVLLPAPEDPRLAGLLDSVPGLRRVSQTSAFELWRVVDTAARVTVVRPDGAVVPVNSGTVSVDGAAVPPGGGTLVLAEPAGAWSASVNGQPLAPLAAPAEGWAQGFRLPPGGGTLTLSHSELPRQIAVGLQALALLVVAVLALPGARQAGEAEAAAAARITARARGGEDRDRARDGDHSDTGRDARPGVRALRRGRDVPGVAEEESQPGAAVPARAESRLAVGGRGRSRFDESWPAGPARPRPGRHTQWDDAVALPESGRDGRGGLPGRSGVAGSPGRDRAAGWDELPGRAGGAEAPRRDSRAARDELTAGGGHAGRSGPAGQPGTGGHAGRPVPPDGRRTGPQPPYEAERLPGRRRPGRFSPRGGSGPDRDDYRPAPGAGRHAGASGPPNAPGDLDSRRGSGPLWDGSSPPQGPAAAGRSRRWGGRRDRDDGPALDEGRFGGARGEGLPARGGYAPRPERSTGQRPGADAGGRPGAYPPRGEAPRRGPAVPGAPSGTGGPRRPRWPGRPGGDSGSWPGGEGGPRAVLRGGLPGDDQTLPPLPPLPPRPGRPRRPAPDGREAGGGSRGRERDQGEQDW